MTREEAINKLVNARYADEFQGDEELTTAHLMAIKALKQGSILDKIETEIRELFKGPAYYIPNYEAYKQILGIINKYRTEAGLFDDKCHYTGKSCYERKCDTCEVEKQEREYIQSLNREYMQSLDKAESEEKIWQK